MDIKVKPRAYLLRNMIQNYAWGTRGADGFIPQLIGVEPQDDTPYAELWMGSHPRASSSVVVEGGCVALDAWIKKYPQEILGETVAQAFAEQLPFLFKVLSVGAPLSIQAHPNPAQAQVLHERDPEHYPDSNHKPEVAIALGNFTALVGFKPFSQMARALKRYPEIVKFVGSDVATAVLDAQAAGVRRLTSDKMTALAQLLFTTLIRTAQQDAVALRRTIDALGGHLLHVKKPLEIEQRFLELHEKSREPDIGLLLIFFLNLVMLRAGQGLFVPSGLPHAYLEGNIIECMANSDNVVRVGLTSKFKDVETLFEVLSYKLGPVSVIREDIQLDSFIYPTPSREFQVTRWYIATNFERVEVPKNGIEILLITEGEVTLRWADGEARYKKGQSILIPALLRTFALVAHTPVVMFKVEVPR